MLNLQEKGMKPFALIIGASALFIAGCAAYFSVRGIALTFGAVSSSFTIPIIIMASSLEFGKLVAASFLYIVIGIPVTERFVLIYYWLLDY